MSAQASSSFTAFWLKEAGKGLQKRQLPTPTPVHGQALVKILAVRVGGIIKNVVDGKSPFPFLPDCVPGAGCIGRIEAVGADSVSFKPGQLVYVDPTIRARDDANAVFIHSTIHGFDEKSNKLVRAWHNGTLAEKVVVPLENTFALDEGVLLGNGESGAQQKKHSIAELVNLQKAVIPYQGWKLAKLQLGETAAVAFATGDFGGAAIDVALAMGAARVLALGRNAEKLAKWRETCDPRYVDRVVCVALTGDPNKDAEAMKQAAPNGIQIFFDMSPPSATATAHLHIEAGIKALERGGRMVWMGYIPKGIPLDYGQLVVKDISLYAKYMYSNQEVRELIRLVEAGLLSFKQYKETLYTGFDNIEHVLEQSHSETGLRQGIVWSPQ